MRALALEHLRSNPVDLYAELLEERRIEVDCVRLDLGDPLPDWRAYDLLVVMGGGMSAYDDGEYPWLGPEKRAIREAVLGGVPYFGVCLGSQLLAAALDGRVFRGPQPELGVNPVFLTPAARHDPVFRAFPHDLDVLDFHQDTFDLPAGAVRLASSPRYANQVFRVGAVGYAIQCHLETSLAEMQEWLALWPALFEELEPRYGGGSLERFFAEYAASVPVLQETARRVFRRWLENAVSLGGSTERRRPASPRASQADVRARIDVLLEEARGGRGGALVVRGEAGLGKTTMVEHAVAHARGMRVQRSLGIESEAEVPFGALGGLAPEAPAAASPGGDRFAAYATALGRLTAATRETPVLVVVDDAHWLDDASAEALAFIARRIGSQRVALLLTVEGDEAFADTGIVDVALAPLEQAAARELLSRTFGEALAQAPAEAVVDSAGGNPLALLEIPRSFSEAERTGKAPVEEALRTRGTAERALLYRLGRLPEDTRSALLVAALAESDDLSLLTEAWRELGLEPAVLPPALDAGIAAVEGGRFSLAHPLVRSAVAYGALRADRQAAHAALAVAFAARGRTELAAWHRAHATTVPDADVASSLADVARLAVARRAYPTAAHAYELAAQLTPDDETRVTRLLDGAEAANLAGHVTAALDLLDAALRCEPEDPLRAGIVHFRGRILGRSGSAEEAVDILVTAANRCAPRDAARAGRMLADAVMPCLRSGRPGEACVIGRRALELVQGSDGLSELSASVALGAALIFTGELAAGSELVRRAHRLATVGDVAAEPELRGYLGLALLLAGETGTARETLAGLVDDLRGRAALGALPYGLVRLADVDLRLGRWAEAAASLEGARRLARETGRGADLGLALGLAGWLAAAQGREEDCRARIEEAGILAERIGTGAHLDRVAAAPGLLELGRDRPAAAVPHLERFARLRAEQGWCDAALPPHAAPDLVEALVRSGRREEAQEVLARFESSAERVGRESALAASARCRGLLADDFDEWFRTALGFPEPAVEPFERARTLLCHAERLLGAERTAEAHEAASSAAHVFGALGATPWLERARAPLPVAVA